MRRQLSSRVLGPYLEDQKWRIVFVCNGQRMTRMFSSKKEAEQRKRELEEEISLVSDLTIQDAFDQYKDYLLEVRQNTKRAVETTMYRLKRFFPSPEMSLRSITPQQGLICYQRLFHQYAAANHRIMLARAKAFLKWCVENKWLEKNPLEEIAPQGKANRGKAQLRLDEARVWYQTAIAYAKNKEPGAVAALVALLLGLRATEIVSLVVRDVDDQGRLLWVDGTKSKAAKRALEVPECLRPHLLSLCKNRDPHERLFRRQSRRYPLEWVKRICKAAQVPEVTAHGMRGLHSTLAIQAGVTPHAVAGSLGHESFSTTLTYYAAPHSLETQRRNRLFEQLEKGETHLN